VVLNVGETLCLVRPFREPDGGLRPLFSAGIDSKCRRETADHVSFGIAKPGWQTLTPLRITKEFRSASRFVANQALSASRLNLSGRGQRKVAATISGIRGLCAFHVGTMLFHRGQVSWGSSRRPLLPSFAASGALRLACQVKPWNCFNMVSRSDTKMCPRGNRGGCDKIGRAHV